MKHTLRHLCPALILTGALAGGSMQAADAQPAQNPNPDMEAMMKKAAEAGAPGAAHQLLEPLVGDWNAEVKMWLAPDAPPTITKATAKNTWALNGRFVRQEFKGEFMNQPFTGLSFTGYDNIRRKYSTVWIDDMSTAIVTMEGNADAAGKVITFEGTYSCAMTGEPHKAGKQICRVLSHNTHVFEMHDPALGENAKTMEITYTRK